MFVNLILNKTKLIYKLMFSDLACSSVRSMLCSVEDNKNQREGLNLYFRQRSRCQVSINDSGAAVLTNDQFNTGSHVHTA